MIPAPRVLTEGMLTEKVLSSTDLSDQYPTTIYPVIQTDSSQDRVVIDNQDWESFASSQDKKS